MDIQWTPDAPLSGQNPTTRTQEIYTLHRKGNKLTSPNNVFNIVLKPATKQVGISKNVCIYRLCQNRVKTFLSPNNLSYILKIKLQMNETGEKWDQII